MYICHHMPEGQHEAREEGCVIVLLYEVTLTLEGVKAHSLVFILSCVIQGVSLASTLLLRYYSCCIVLYCFAFFFYHWLNKLTVLFNSLAVSPFSVSLFVSFSSAI